MQLPGQQTFRFRAATGDGAVVSGSVSSTSSQQVLNDLLRQGLIPVQVTQVKTQSAPNPVLFRKIVNLLKSRN